MRRSAVVMALVVIAGVGLVSLALAGGRSFTAHLSGGNEVPPMTRERRGRPRS